MATFCGIDPGLDGAVVIIRFNSDSTIDAITRVMPTIQLKKSKRNFNIKDMADIFRNIQGTCWIPTLTILERAQAMPKQGVTSMFSTGRGFGLWEGILTALSIPYMTVPPTVWHRKVCAGLKGKPKTKALKKVQETLPTLNLLATPRCKKPHSGIVDAACLALWGGYL